MWFSGQLNSFLNLGECKEYSIMARSKSIPSSKSSRNATNKAVTGSAANAAEVKPAAEETLPQTGPEDGISQEATLTPEDTGAKEVRGLPEPRKLEIVKNEFRKNVLPINLEDEIRRRAYELYQRRGPGSGNEAEDWLAAEQEVRHRYRQQSA
jgi:Protein of unknown function (DUF2934)